MKSVNWAGLIIALVLTVASGFASAETSANTAKPKAKRHQVKKQQRSTRKAKKQFSKVSKKSVSDETAKLSTDINFNDSVLHGRYQTPDEATAKVENDKSLADLIGVRTQFKDRLKKASEQN